MTASISVSEAPLGKTESRHDGLRTTEIAEDLAGNEALEVRSESCQVAEAVAAGAASGMPSNASRCRRSDDPVATAIVARSAQPGGHTSTPVDCSPSRRSRRNGPASWPTGEHAGRRSADSGYPGTSPSPPPALGHSGPWP